MKAHLRNTKPTRVSSLGKQGVRTWAKIRWESNCGSSWQSKPKDVVVLPLHPNQRLPLMIFNADRGWKFDITWCLFCASFSNSTNNFQWACFAELKDSNGTNYNTKIRALVGGTGMPVSFGVCWNLNLILNPSLNHKNRGFHFVRCCWKSNNILLIDDD